MRNPNQHFTTALLSNYTTIAVRSLLKHKLILFISIIGLVIGFTGAILICLFTFDELQYDQHFKNKDRLYRVTATYPNQSHFVNSAETNANVAGILKDNFAEIEHATRLMASDEAFFLSSNVAVKESIIYTDASFLRVFELPLLLGNANTCLIRPSSLIISESLAERLFGKDWEMKQILGEILSIDDRIPMTITGVFDDLPPQTHLKSNLFASIPSGFESWLDDQQKVYTYLLLQASTDKDEFQNKIHGLQGSVQRNEGAQAKLELQPVTQIYLSARLDADNSAHANPKVIYGMMLAGIFLIIITTINFANLYTANCLNRLKEIGVRKAVGAFNNQIRNQFLFETAIITLIASILAMIFVFTLLPTFSALTNKEFSVQHLLSSRMIFVISMLICLVAGLSGIYPSLQLPTTKTINALKGTKSRSGPLKHFQQALLVIQFSISCIMIILSIVAIRQVHLITHKPLGFDKENIVAIQNPYMLGGTEKVLALRNELLNVSGIRHVSITGYTPSQNRWGNKRFTFPARDPQSRNAIDAHWLTVDEGFVQTIGLKLLSGRDFLENHDIDRGSILINKTAVREFAFDSENESPIGKDLSFESERESGSLEHYKIVGIVEDFNFGSLHEPIRPLIMKLGYHRFEMAMRIAAGYSRKSVLEDVARVWRKHLPLIPFNYEFVSDRFERLHRSDITASRLFSVFCGLIVMMAVFGLFSILAHSIVARTKEIGIRKVLGAPGTSIIWLLVKRFFALLVAAYVLGVPVGWILATTWIADFAYKTEISWWIFASTGWIMICITTLTVGYQAVRASSANPVDNLKYE